MVQYVHCAVAALNLVFLTFPRCSLERKMLKSKFCNHLANLKSAMSRQPYCKYIDFLYMYACLYIFLIHNNTLM